MTDHIDLDVIEAASKRAGFINMPNTYALALVRAVRAAMGSTSTWRGEGNGRVSIYSDEFDALRAALAPFRKEAT